MSHLDDPTTAQQIQSFLDTHGGVAVLDLYANWCGPCKQIAPYVHKKNKDTGIALISIDVDKAGDLATKYQIEAMPTFIVVKGKWNNVIERVVGGGQGNVDKVYNKALQSK